VTLTERAGTEARQRAEAFLAATDYFAALGLERLSVDGRMLARLVLELADQVDAERSARRAMQERCERQQAILGRQTDQALRQKAR
jgi:hypothetical protein